MSQSHPKQSQDSGSSNTHIESLSRRGSELTHLSRTQAHIVAAIGEFIGTYLFLFFGYAGHLMAVSQAGEMSINGGVSQQTVLTIAIAYGFSLLVNVWAFYRISGGLFNPAVTLGLCLSSQLSWIRGLFLTTAQLIACMCAGGMVNALFPGKVSLVNTLLAPDTSIAQGVFIEMFLTAQLIFVVLMLAVEKSKDTFLAPIGIGLSVFIAEIPGVYFSGGSINPARSFGCAVAGRQFPGYHWIYWVGPCLGACLSAGVYRLAKYFHYEEANPGQDAEEFIV